MDWLLSHPMVHEKNLKEIINTLLENCFPLPFIFTTINTRIKTLANRTVRDIENTNCLLQINERNFFLISNLFLKVFVEKFKKNITKKQEKRILKKISM